MFKNYEKKYVKAKPDDDNDPDDPDEATEATEATTGTKITYFGLGKSTFFGRQRCSKIDFLLENQFLNTFV